SAGAVGGGTFRVGTSLRRLVKDPSGAVISHARVVVRNEETGSSQDTTTDASGHYRFDNVQAGNSALFVNAPGFQRFELTNFYLGAGRNNEIDATLNVGTAAETVTVNVDADGSKRRHPVPWYWVERQNK